LPSERRWSTWKTAAFCEPLELLSLPFSCRVQFHSDNRSFKALSPARFSRSFVDEESKIGFMLSILSAGESETPWTQCKLLALKPQFSPFGWIKIDCVCSNRRSIKGQKWLSITQIIAMTYVESTSRADQFTQSEEKVNEIYYAWKTNFPEKASGARNN
jgi:hypothetical protein